MRHLNRLMLFVAAAAFAACSEDGVLEPQQPDASFSVSGRGARHVTVMTRNMYIGADVDAAMAALATPDQTDDLPAMMTALETLQRTDFAARVQAMADEIARNRPQVVGVQEAYKLSLTPELLGLPPGAPVEIDFLAALQWALGARGLNYTLAGKNTTTDATVGVGGGAVRIIDHDALLVDADRVTLEGQPVEKVFDVNLGEVATGVSLLRGYVARQATVGGVPMLLVSSHFEAGKSADIVEIRRLQAAELAQYIGGAPRVVLLGDLNDVAGSPMYRVLARRAQLLDTWAAMRPRVEGLTCCHLPDLSNRRPNFYSRIDYVWTRGFDGPSGRVQGEITRTGMLPRERVNGAFGLIWPSDHAGLVATFVLPASVLR